MDEPVRCVELPECWKHPGDPCTGYCQYVLRRNECAAAAPMQMELAFATPGEKP